MASASEWACKPGTRPQVLSMMPLEWFVLLFLIVLWRPSLPHTMKQRAIVAQVWPPLPSEHAKDECLACMLTRKRRPYLSNDCHTWATIALCFIVWGKDGLHKTMRNNSTNHSRDIIDSTWGWVPGLHAHSEAEAILEQQLLFVSLCEARMAFTRLWGIIVRIIPEASLTASEDECLACMLTRKRRPYLSNDCSLFHCVRQGWPSQDYEE